MSIVERLSQMSLVLPEPTAPVANYVPYKFAGGTLYLSGMIPTVAGTPHRTGLLGDSVSIEDGVECARICTMNALAWVKIALESNLDRVREVIRIRGFVACTPGFFDHPKVVNGASDLLVDIFGEAGKHTRAAVGAPSLPLNVPVEIDFIFAID